MLSGVILCCVAIFGAVSRITTPLPTGAPDFVCGSMTPGGAHTETAVEQMTPNPWMIDVSAFNGDNDVTVYTPGQSYTITLRPVVQGSNITLRGFFIQGRRSQMPNSTVGSFSDPSTLNTISIAVNNQSLQVTRLSSCSPSNIGVTHNNLQRIDISAALNFTWTAPAVAGFGPIQFHYTVVQNRDTWWASDVSAVVQEYEVNGGTQIQGIGFLSSLVAAATGVLAWKVLLYT